MKTRLAFVTAAVASLLVVGTASVAEAVSTTPARCAQPDGRVSTIAIADGVAYLGGSFTHVKDVSGVSRSRLRLAAVDTSSCDLLPWDPSADGDVYALTVAAGQVFVGGAFGTVGGAARSRIASVSSTAPCSRGTRARTARSGPSPRPSSRLYVGGDFTTIGSTKRSRLAAFSLGTGALDAGWDPKASKGVLALFLLSLQRTRLRRWQLHSPRRRRPSGLRRSSGCDSRDGRQRVLAAPGFPVLSLGEQQRGVYAGAGGAGVIL